MSAPEAKVIKALHAQCRVQANSTDPRAKIEGAFWQLFFELPPHELLRIRDKALSPAAQPTLFDAVEDDHQLARVAEE